MLTRNAKRDIAATTNPKILEKNEKVLAPILVATRDAVEIR